MDIKTLKECLPYLAEARITPLVWGYHGIGKSQAIQQYCDENDFHLFDMRLGTQADAGDLLGLGDIIRNKDGEAVATKFFMPNWLHTMIDWCKNNPEKKAYIFLDEINRAARRDILQAVFQLVLDNRLHENQLPPNCFVVAGANPDTGDYGVLNMDDLALLDRFIHIKLDPPPAEWHEYAKENDHNRSVIGFLKQQPDSLETSDLESFSINDIAKPSRRTWSAISRLVSLDPQENLLMQMLYGLVGTEHTTAFMSYLKKDAKPITIDQILANYADLKEKVLEYGQLEGDGRQDILSTTFEGMHDYFKDRGENKKKLSKEEENNLIEFLIDCPAELVFGHLQTLFPNPILRPVLDNSTDLQNKLRVAKEGMQAEKMDE